MLESTGGQEETRAGSCAGLVRAGGRSGEKWVLHCAAINGAHRPAGNRRGCWLKKVLSDNLVL